MRGQADIFGEIIVDNFAGGGGASTGIELATGRIVDLAINHDPDAILMHKTNHPHTEHLQTSVWDVDPVEVCRGRPVGLAWFSPDCKHFSKAKGGKPVSKNIRGLAWIVLRWAALVRPRVIILENVEEFQTWGPVRRGRPVRSKQGQTFRRWKRQLSALGYAIEHRELVAADYGAPTIRKRFFLVARCDGKPIVWPEPTHSKDGSGGLKPWRAAAEVIDWSMPCPSIFGTKAEIKERYGLGAVRPLADNTLRRVIRGVDKFTIRSGKPFIVQLGYGERKGQGARVNSIESTLGTAVSKEKFSAASPCLIQYHTEQTENARGQGMGDPIQTVDASNRYGLASANLVEYFGNGNPLDVSEPLHTITAKDREALTIAYIQKYFDGGYTGCGSAAQNPIGTVTAQDHNALCLSHVCKFKGQDIGQHLADPLQTITTSAGEFAAVKTTVIEYAPGAELNRWPEIRALLNKYCFYDLKDDEILLLSIGGVWYYIADIGLRMLTPRELYNAQGFPTDYIIDRDYLGNEYGKTKQVARCGNAVCPPLATALVRANLPEWCQTTYVTMAALMRAVAI